MLCPMLIKEDRDVTYREIEASFGISKNSIKNKLLKELRVKKLVSGWIPHLSTDETLKTCTASSVMINRGFTHTNPKIKCTQSFVWMFQGEEYPTVIRSRSVSKRSRYLSQKQIMQQQSLCKIKELLLPIGTQPFICRM